MEEGIVFTKKRNAKYLRIRIKGDGTCMVTVPFRVPMKWAEKFVEEKKEWIEKARAKLPHIRPVRSYPSYQDVKHSSLHFTTQRVAELNQHYGFSYGKISVRNQQTRWGSCSKRGNLNFNYRILFLPPHLAEYLIVHELCHLKEFNHSPRFWALVAQTIPEYRECRRELRVWQ
jgi:predicted metal-dependent hydrolase